MQQKASRMARKSSVIARKAWEVLRVSLNIEKLVKKAIHSTNESTRALLYGDHEFSFHNTPRVHVRMTRPPSALRCCIPCITPRHHDVHDATAMRSVIVKGEEITETEDSDDDEGIDQRAEEFIAKFYEEMKLQTQIDLVPINK